MLLRSSSAPTLGALLSPFSDCSIQDSEATDTTISNRNDSLIDLSTSGNFKVYEEANAHNLKAIRRLFSDGNLTDLAYNSCEISDIRAPRNLRKLISDNRSMLHTAPSFSLLTEGDGSEHEEDSACGEVEALRRTITIGECIHALESSDFTFRKKGMELFEEEGKKSMKLIEEEKEELRLNPIHTLRVEDGEVQVVSPMRLATGLGINGPDFSHADIKLSPTHSSESDDVQEHYKRMAQKSPHNPLLLREYAQLLQSKGKFHEAEEYYSRATLADPGDGQILMHYAKLVWELHHDREEALKYYERAAEAAPYDSGILAAYAGFLWEMEDEQEDGTEHNHIEINDEEISHKVDKSGCRKEVIPINQLFHLAAGCGTDVSNTFSSDFGEGSNIEEYHKIMSKGGFQRIGSSCLHDMLAEPSDGERMSEYARLMWDLHHDHDKALCCFEKAVEAAAGNSTVLAAYARFLWEIEFSDQENSPRS